jgi:hypothetical protein
MIFVQIISKNSVLPHRERSAEVAKNNKENPVGEKICGEIEQ